MQQKTQITPAQLRWADVFPEWPRLHDGQRQIIRSMYFSQPIEVCRNYVRYCVEPSYLAMEAEKRRVMDKIIQDRTQSYTVQQLCQKVGVAEARCRIILDDYFKGGLIGRDSIKGEFVYQVKGGKIRGPKNGHEMIFEFIKDCFPFREAIYKKFEETMSPSYIDQCIKKLKKTHGITTTWDIQRKAPYYKVGGKDIFAKDCQKELLLAELKDGPATMMVIGQRTNQRKSSLQSAVNELIKEGKAEIYKTKQHTTFYCLAGEGQIWKELGV